MNDRECANCPHPESQHDMIQCRGKEWFDTSSFRCPCTDFVPKTPAEARDDGMTRAEYHADAEWKERALSAVQRTCLERQEFISDDVWDVGGLDSTHEDRALGSIMRAAARNQWCRKSDRVRPSKRSHLSGKPVWVSLIYREVACQK